MTLGDIKGRIWDRLDDASGESYSAAHVTRMVNLGQRVFATLTLCIERTVSLPLDPGVAWYLPLSYFSDWIAPLRVQTVPGVDYTDTSVLAGSLFDAVTFADTTLPTIPTAARVRPVRLQDLDALNSAWQSTAGTPEKYGCLGWNLLYLYKQPSAVGTSLTVIHAALPAELSLDADTPEIPSEYHQELVNFGEAMFLLPDGGNRASKGLALINGYLAAAGKLAAYMRQRNMALRYDTLPPEIRAQDRSRMAKGLAKQAKEAA